jgi:hypothetical protein
MDLLLEASQLFTLRGNEIKTYINEHPNFNNQLICHTSFLPLSARTTERTYCVLNSINERHKCISCENNTKWYPSLRRYAIYCSLTCRSNDTTLKDKTKQTNRERYGVDYVSQSDTVKDKIKQTNIERYGVENPLLSKQIKDKIKQTNIERYGVENPLLSKQIKDKAKQTNKERYGAEYVLQSKEGQLTFKQTCLEKYGVTNPLQSTTIKTKRKNNNQIKYGVDNPSQLNLLPDTLLKLKNCDWLYTQHIILKKSLLRISNELCCNDLTVGNYLHNHNIPTQIYSISIGESEVSQFITSHNIQIEHNNRTIISPLELDLYIPTHNLAIEYCGLYWHSDTHSRIDNNYHKRKHDLCANKGIQLITIFEDEWQQKQEQVKQKLLSLLNKDNRNSVYARKTHIVLVSNKNKQLFFENNHIQGNGPGSINIGLEYEGTLVACMSFIKQKEQHYLNRYATSCRVPGGFSKLLKYFQHNYEWKKVISFADLRWSNGNLYEKTGWKLDSVLPPDYSYIRNNERIHKFNYRRKNLPRLLEHFNLELSERENCNNNGILRIWDCGKLKYTTHNQKK